MMPLPVDEAQEDKEHPYLQSDCSFSSTVGLSSTLKSLNVLLFFAQNRECLSPKIPCQVLFPEAHGWLAEGVVEEDAVRLALPCLGSLSIRWRIQVMRIRGFFFSLV